MEPRCGSDSPAGYLFLQVIIFVGFDLVSPLKKTLLLPPRTSFNYSIPETTVAS